MTLGNFTNFFLSLRKFYLVFFHRFKWSAETIQETIGNLLGHVAVPEYYKTPPYLTVEPDVISTKLTPRDKFLVIGSDGLWDMMTPMQVIFKDSNFFVKSN